jgi:hypothetical protein
LITFDLSEVRRRSVAMSIVIEKKACEPQTDNACSYSLVEHYTLWSC